MTEMWTFIDGVKVNIPKAPWQAEDFGWHKGAEFSSPLFLTDEQKYDLVYKWCKETFGPAYTYKMFLRSVWFYREEDATLCKLRWA